MIWSHIFITLFIATNITDSLLILFTIPQDSLFSLSAKCVFAAIQMANSRQVEWTKPSLTMMMKKQRQMKWKVLPSPQSRLLLSWWHWSYSCFYRFFRSNETLPPFPTFSRKRASVFFPFVQAILVVQLRSVVYPVTILYIPLNKDLWWCWLMTTGTIVISSLTQLMT